MHPTDEPERILDLLQQHLSSFYQAANSQAGNAIITAHFNAVIKDTSRLFALEEAALSRMHSPDIEQHRQRHAALLSLARHLRTNLELGAKDAPLSAVLFTEEWLEQHLRGVDQPFLSVAA